MKPAKAAIVIAGIVAMVVTSRLAHLDLVWVEEAYGMAAAAELVRGKVLYRDIWFDKPPLYAVYYALIGATAGWPLRLAGAAVVLAGSWASWLLARHWWSSREGLIAAFFTAFSLTFWIPSAVMAVAPDLLMITPHLLAIYFAARRWPSICGMMCAVALHANAKAVLLLPACLLWVGRDVMWFALGFAPAFALPFLFMPFSAYVDQVWRWGARYAADPFGDSPYVEGIRRTANWAGFHAAAVVATIVFLWRTRDPRALGWTIFSAGGVVGGARFFPRYYFQLLPVIAVYGARGIMLVSRRWRIAILALLLVPALRFGPRYVSLMTHGATGWSDVAMMEDSRQAGEWLRAHAAPGDSLLVWGYRPDIYVFSGLPAGTPFLDSQPLNGVLADRHLSVSKPTLPDVAAANRRRLAAYRPMFVVDGLGPVNGALAIDRESGLSAWFNEYMEVHRTQAAIIYRRR